MRLLIVEDSEVAASALRLLFEQDGFDVSVAATVGAAITRARELRPDVMLLDATLADGSGLSVLEALGATGELPANTLAMTGHDDDEMRERYIEAGCADVLLKPVPIAQLVARVRSF